MAKVRMTREIGYTYSELESKRQDAIRRKADKYEMQRIGLLQSQFLREARENVPEFDFTYHLDNGWKQALEQIGFTDVKIMFSGFSSQGGGACFSSEWIDIPALIRFMYQERFVAQNVVDYANGTDEYSKAKDGNDYRKWLSWILNDEKSNESGPMPNFIRHAAWTAVYGPSFGDEFIQLCEAMSVRFVHSGHYYHYKSCELEWEDNRRGDDVAFTDDDDEILEDVRSDIQRLFNTLAQAIYKELDEINDEQESDEYALSLAAEYGLLLWVHDPDWEATEEEMTYSFKPGDPELTPCVGGES